MRKGLALLHIATEASDEAQCRGTTKRLRRNPPPHPGPDQRHAHGICHISTTIGSNGISCSDCAPPPVTMVSAPSWRPMRSSGVIGLGWITIAMLDSKRRPSGAGRDSSHGQYSQQDLSMMGGWMSTPYPWIKS